MKKNNKNSKKPAVIALYVISILFGIYAIFTMYNSYTYISSLVSQGLSISEELLNVIEYFVGNSSPYIFYAIATWGIGYIVNKLNFISEGIKVENSVDLEAEIMMVEANEEISEEVNEEVAVADSEEIK